MIWFMSKNMVNFKYKKFTGTIEGDSEQGYTGRVVDLKVNNTYQGRNLEELEGQFKTKVECFYANCLALGVEPKIKGNRQLSKWPYITIFFTALLGVALIIQLYSGTQSNLIGDGDLGSHFNNWASPLFSFLSFVGLLYTISQQIVSHHLSLDELALTREELEMTRKEIEKTTIANQEQADALKNQVIEAQNRAKEQRQLAQEQQRITQVQQFENTFFSLLANHEKSLNKITEREDGKSIAENALINLKSKQGDNRRRSYNFFEYNEVTSYFIVLYQMLKFIKKYPHIEESDDDQLLIEKKYTSLIRAYIPNDVLILILFNCFVNESSDKSFNSFKKYQSIIERYSFLEHISIRKDIFYPNDLKLITNSYSINNCAFGNNIDSIKANVKDIVRFMFLDKINDELIKCNFYDYKEELKDDLYNIESDIRKNDGIVELYCTVMKYKYIIELDLKIEDIKEQEIYEYKLARLKMELRDHYDGELYPEVKQNNGTVHYFKKDELKFILNKLEIIRKVLNEKLLNLDEVFYKEKKMQELRDAIEEKKLSLELSIKEGFKTSDSDFGLNKDGILYSELRYYIDSQ